jgi:hypothetical protein
VPEPWVGESRFCGRGPEECDGIAEPEEDGEARYFKCTKPECGFEFGYTVVQQQDNDFCQLGISTAGLRELEDGQFRVPVGLPQCGGGNMPPTPRGHGVFLGSTIRRRAE